MARRRLIVERDVEATMRDGTILRADVYRPAAADRLPVLLQRTPYGKAYASTGFALMAADRGYAVVAQDTRGRWASEGDGYPLIHEKLDGYDTVEWAAQQPWSDGQVGMFGMSYVGYTQLAAAVTRPPALKAIIPGVTFCDARSIGYVGGALALGVGVSWSLMAVAMMEVTLRPRPDAEREALMAKLISEIDGMALGQTFRHLPLSEAPLIGRNGLIPFMSDWISHPTADAYWERLNCPHGAIDIPTFHIGGWYDIFATSTVRDFTSIREQGNTHQRLLMGPWTHGNYDGLVGETYFGMQASGDMILPDEQHLRWFDHWLKGVDNGVMDEPPVRIFVMGDNVWRSEDDWPLARTQYERFYLHSGGAANTLSGDGVLSHDAPSEEPVDSFVYDPRNPVPTRGGGLCCWRAALPPGAFDQREIEARPDVLIYTTPVLERDLEVTGPLEVHLWAATSAPDTDFTAKLVDVGRCGYARNIQDGIVRARYRKCLDQPEPIHPGVVYEYTIDLGATSNVFKAGHRIRVEISSSNFPRFDRNTNTAAAIGEGIELRTALQTVLHDADHPSHIVLPVIPR